jgi:glycosyltransferase involved in cell wall biosynthesis
MLVELCDADPLKIDIVAPGVDHARFRPLDAQECRRQLKLAEDRRYLLMVGRTTPLKGIEVLLEARALMPGDERTVLLVVGGEKDGERLRRLAAAAEAHGLGEKVQFIGSVSHDSLPLYYGAADICVVPSYYESYGMVALEAQACGRPVVASAIGGLASVVTDGVNGLLVPPGSPPELSHALQRLLADPALAKRLGASGVYAARPRTWRATAEGIVAALLKCESVPATAPVVP